MTASPYFSTHTHSQFSTLDAIAKVPDLVRRAAMNGQPGMALTDHGLMSGTVQLYKAAKKYNIKPFPGVEGYMIDPSVQDWENPPKGTKVGRYHLGLLSLNEDGYKALVKFVSMTHTRPRFNRFPRFTLSDLAELGQAHGEDLALTTGCFSGLPMQTLMNEGEDAAKRVIAMYANWFPNTYVELHNHRMPLPDGRTDGDLAKSLESIADDLGLLMVAGQDTHYLNQKDRAAHGLMKRMTYGSENEFSGDSFHMASTEWMEEHFTKSQWAGIEEGCQDLLDKHDLRIKPLDTFVPDVPWVSKDPRGEMLGLLETGLSDYLDRIGVEEGSEEEDIYYDRLDYEVDVIDFLKMPAYFMIWVRFVAWCRAEHIAIEARGSANGSLVCFLLGITQVDPIMWDVDFDRFLSKDRIKPPDVDMDIEDSERPRAVQWLLNAFEAVQIGTYSKLGTTIDPETGEERGSVMVSWKASKRNEAEALATKRWEEGKLAKKGDIKAYAAGIFNRQYGGVESVEDVARIDKRDGRGLRQLSTMKSAFKSYGVHAGGVLLSGQHVKIDDYIPTMLVASSDTRVSQFDMDDVEEFGLLKMDILGQATLRTMKVAQQLMGRDDPTFFGWIPDDDPEACKHLRSGRTDTGIFHFEGYTKAKGGRELGVKSTADSILVHALYMPGAMNVAPGQTMSAKDHYVKARKDRVFRKSVKYGSDVLEKHLSPTYGAFVYQNQVLAILRDLGMDVATINVFLKVVKDSGDGALERNRERTEALHDQYIDLCGQNNVPDPEGLWGQLTTFGAYGFNKAHATGYGIRSYRCGYMKAHYPLEFMTALLVTWAGRKKETLYVRESRHMGIRLLPPHVNVSTSTWTIDEEEGAIRKGLVSIAGIGDTTADQIAAEAPYESIEDMVKRLPARVITGGKMFLAEGKISGTLAKLRDAGAIDNLN